jgi:hypothetical protein
LIRAPQDAALGVLFARRGVTQGGAKRHRATQCDTVNLRKRAYFQTRDKNLPYKRNAARLALFLLSYCFMWQV